MIKLPQTRRKNWVNKLPQKSRETQHTSRPNVRHINHHMTKSRVKSINMSAVIFKLVMGPVLANAVPSRLQAGVALKPWSRCTWDQGTVRCSITQVFS